MVPELGFHRSKDLAHLTGENDFVELSHHLTRAELAQGAALLAGRAGGIIACDHGEIGPGFDLVLQGKTGGLGGD
jgi:hypothetical protein